MARVPAHRRVALLAVLTLLLAACGSTPTTTDPEVTVTGQPGAAPTVTYLTPLTVDETYRETVWPGTGAELVEGAPVLIDFWLENATDASLVKESYSTSPTPRPLTEEDLGTDLYETLRGQRVGARLLQVAPAGQGADYPTVTVLDVLPTRAVGEPVTPNPALPAVTLAEDGSPSITPTGTPPPADLVVQPLVRGTGPQVASGDVITVHYSGFAWDTGDLFDASWERVLPVSFLLSDVQAWAEGLVDQPAGSQVMLVVPPTYPLGVTDAEELAGQTVVFVIDILATGAPAEVTR
ncbi:FKBP-type peptidyl-prolyl cis-trans isomerase [Cellulomonas sp. JZ18]|uniref:FKBP-type peptidyl-prolyl cis-trans isomerase n=1 Tax=Cellulomonas sp. JZ18 TaxID=2654191 RepID=UPI0012D4A22D|nr:FKBP-type peptidyl-prolyl cis-trans isomerase [Cellulomonas sp. JZ18]QGQ19185.1 FKBP-type peptidyl-prolyl cis-trans isomerase [Cellulomonas sp. JZ18]